MTHRIFIVEDHAAMRSCYVMFLGRLPEVEVVGAAESAEEALEALEALEAASVDMLLIDISLPGMSGLELVARLRDEQPRLKLVVITGHGERRYAEAAERAGVDGFVVKGDTDEMLATLRRVMAA